MDDRPLRSILILGPSTSFPSPPTTTSHLSSSTTASPPSKRASRPSRSFSSSKTSPIASRTGPSLSSPPVKEASPYPPRGLRVRCHSFEAHPPTSSDQVTAASSSQSRFSYRRKSSWIPPTILRPPSVRLANPVNYVPRNTPVTVPHLSQLSDENLPLDAHRDAYPLLTIPERRRSRPTPSPNSLVVERSQGETESGRSSIAVPRGQRRSGAFDDQLVLREMSESGVSNGAPEVKNPRAPERAHLGFDFAVDGPGPLHDDRPRHIQSQSSLRSQSHIASVPSITGAQNGGETDVAEELAWGPAHPCYPHINPHVPIGSEEYMTTRIIRIRRDWMIKGDLAPTFSNLYPEILDPLLPEQEFRKVIATVNDELIKAFDPFSVRNFIDSALSLLTGWIWEDIGAPGIKSHLKRVEAWLERWNREVGAKDGVHIWSLRRTAYMSLDIQIPDPKVGIIRSEGVPSLPGTRPSSGV
ncbi:Ras modification protein ERF4 [Aspergillus awamori]|uniref:Ras modification protein ERF4 n=2 Tax=Aspergillus TaxID=5052 RepID=A0A401KYC3_ASPAW|nr:Ras modification protein ERF4 [Aspergillus awamori]